MKRSSRLAWRTAATGALVIAVRLVAVLSVAGPVPGIARSTPSECNGSRPAARRRTFSASTWSSGRGSSRGPRDIVGIRPEWPAVRPFRHSLASSHPANHQAVDSGNGAFR
jgi:hypothetical protein